MPFEKGLPVLQATDLEVLKFAHCNDAKDYYNKLREEALTNRVDMLTRAKTDKALQSVLYSMCQDDIIFWMNNFCWTFDPRAKIGHMPLILFPYQDFVVREIQDAIHQQEDWCIDKSRDMGISWLLILIMQHGWLFHPGWSFLVGSRKESEVDRNLVDPEDTMFGKFRYNLQRQPPWIMRKRDYIDHKLAIQNTLNGNKFTGESANPSFGRGARKRCIYFDELNFWDCADAAWAASSQTTKCRGAGSTPYGDTTTFARLANNPDNNRVILPDELVPLYNQDHPKRKR